DQGAEPQRAGHSGEGVDRRPRVERAAPGVLAVEVQVVVGAKQGRDAVAFTRLRQRLPLRPAHALLTFDHQAQVHGDSSLIEGFAMVLLPRRGALIAAAALSAAVLTGCGSGGSKKRRPGQPPAPTVVTVRAGKPGRTVPYGFVGLSVEFRSV